MLHPIATRPGGRAVFKDSGHETSKVDMEVSWLIEMAHRHIVYSLLLFHNGNWHGVAWHGDVCGMAPVQHGSVWLRINPLVRSLTLVFILSGFIDNSFAISTRVTLVSFCTPGALFQ